MAKSSKSKASLWYGYLNAGARSSPVLRDERLGTGNPKTLYLFNLMRGEILEYAREIVEKKLRELKPAESGCITELDAGYKKVRRNFKGRGAGIHTRKVRAGTVYREDEEYSDDKELSDVIMGDDDMWEDAEEA